MPFIFRPVFQLKATLHPVHHIWSQPDILDIDVFLHATEILFETAKNFKDLSFIDFGSGFKVPYKPGDIETNIEELGEKLTEKFNNFCQEYGRELTLAFEPGKFLVSEAGYFLTKVNVGPFNVQKYFPGDHFAALHSERTGLSTLHRIFAFMTYLNDVDDGGTTDFEHYGLKIKPEKNKTLIWPAEWTHAHTGSVLKSGTKYIITGWFDFASWIQHKKL